MVWMAFNASYAVLALFGVLTAAVAALAMGFFSSDDKFQVEGCTVIVTGGSQGLGLAFAKQLAAKGANVVIVARNVSKLRAALAEIKKQAKNPKQRFESLSYDLESPDTAPEILETVHAMERWRASRCHTQLRRVLHSRILCINKYQDVASTDGYNILVKCIYGTCSSE